MNFFSFTPQESKAIIFLVVILLMGSGVTLYKKYHPEFAPELLLSRKEYRERKIPEHKNTFDNEGDVNLKKPEEKIDLNSASLEELITLPGIGRELGKRILIYREEKGGFSCIEELTEVKGIGPKTLDRLKNLINVE